MDVLDTHFIEVFEVSAVPAVCAEILDPLAVEPGRPDASSRTGHARVSAAPS
jgi:hypothetical protein